MLIPIAPSGIFLDLIEKLEQHITKIGLTTVAFFYVSPAAEHSLSYANIAGEWFVSRLLLYTLTVRRCCDARRDKIYLPEDPFEYGQLMNVCCNNAALTHVQTKRLRAFPNLSGGFAPAYREPCVVFVDHISLRCGNILPLIDMLGADDRNSLVLIGSFPNCCRC